MTDQQSIFVQTKDPAVERLSVLLAKPAHASISSTLFHASTRIAVDVNIIRGAMVTLVIAEATFPILPPPGKLAAIASAALAAVSLVAATADIAAQLGKLRIPGSILNTLSDAELRDMTDRLKALSDPIDALVDKAIEFLGKAGVLDADMAAVLKSAKAYAEARAQAEKAVTLQDKVTYGLASIEAAKELLEKVTPAVKEKLQREYERARREKELEESEPQYPNGVDYPNPPNGDPNSGTAIA